MNQTVVISSPTCFGYCVSIIRELHCAWLKLRMCLYVEIVQIVQRQGLAVICRQVMYIRISFYLLCNHRFNDVLCVAVRRKSTFCLIHQ
jgi:hypothetical protein